MNWIRFSPLCLLGFIVGCFNANPAERLHNMPQNTGFSVQTVRSSNEAHRYSIFVPRDYTPGKKYPTIVFLHGIGEAGDDGVKCTTVGIGPAIAKRDGNFPFIVLFPQAGWDWTGDKQGQLVCDVIDDASKKYSIDLDRVSLSGLSSGGKGVWVLGARYPDRFAALVPMGGYAADDAVPKLARVRMPVWALHNSGDIFVPVGGSRSMINKLKAAGAGDVVHYTEYGDFGHNCWDKAYDSGELFAWLQQQHRNGRSTAMAR